MLRWRHEHEDAPTRLARRAAATRLGVAATRLEAAGYRRRARGDTRRRQPVAQTWARAGRGGAAAAPCPRSHAHAQRRASSPTPHPAGARGRGLRVSWPGLDLQAGRRGHPPHVRRHLPPCPCQPATAHPATECAAPPCARRAARRAGDPGVVAWWRERWPALEKKPPRKGEPSSG